MTKDNFEFQIIFFLAYGVLFGGLCKSLFVSLLFILIYEFFIFHVTRFYPPEVKEFDRVALNIIYIFGWIMGRYLILNETGFEDIVVYF